MDALPITITKTVWGQVGIALGAIAVVGLVLTGLITTYEAIDVDPLPFFGFSVLLLFLIGAFAVVWMYVYSLSYVFLDTNGLTAVNWVSLFNKQNVQAEWSDVEDVSTVTSGFFAQMLGFGTLNVQTAGTRQNLRMVMVPNVEHWQEVIAHYADAATTT